MWTLVFAAGCATGSGSGGAGAAAPSAAPEASGVVAPGPIAMTSTSPTITPAELKRDLYAFADDSMRGREAGTPDAVRAAAFIADRLKLLGLEPAGDSGYFQRVPMDVQEILPATTFTVTRGGATVSPALGTDLLPLTDLGPGAYGALDATGNMVYGAYGIDDDALNRHDLRGLDVKDKVLVLIHGAPPGADSAAKVKYNGQAYLSVLLQEVLPLHPAAVVVLMTADTRELFDEAGPSLLRAVTLHTGAPEPTAKMRVFPMILLGVTGAGSPLLPAGWTADAKPGPLGASFSGHVALGRHEVNGYNVVAISRGIDRQMRETYVAFGAHLDHIGIQSGMTPDSIANGADDDGSGSMSLLAIARASREIPHGRSLLFVWHTGEEKGLLGSSWFTDHATVPIDSIVAQLNADMVGRNAPDELYIVGPGAAPNGQSKVLGAILDSVNASESQPFRFNRMYDTLTDPERIYYRSDHYNYARKGIPIVFFTTGLHADYHKVSDSPDKISYVKMALVDRLMMDVGLTVANRRTRPK
jgi:hypothetical protein